MTNTLVQEYESVRETFRVWHAEQESLDAQLAESLAALTAYQSHLDSWQQQLARERAELQARCEELTRERADFETTKAAAEHTSAEAGEELRAAREKIAVLSSSLSERTEEFRTVDQQRSELAAELELISTREKELKLALDEQKRCWSAGTKRTSPMQMTFGQNRDQPSSRRRWPPGAKVLMCTARIRCLAQSWSSLANYGNNERAIARLRGRRGKLR
jgi:chromosome segregation ATPase